jgi:hypothetical protein
MSGSLQRSTVFVQTQSRELGAARIAAITASPRFLPTIASLEPVSKLDLATRQPGRQ